MIMSRLKGATLNEHHEVEARMPVLDPALTEAAYAGVLRGLSRVVGPLEARLVALPLPAAFELGRRLKAPLLARDLGALTGTRPGPPSVPSPSLPPALFLPGVPEALGALYVLEGATLGGQGISRHLRRTLGVTPGRGGAYFHGYGPATGPMWRAFGEAMRGAVTPGDEARVIAGARATFRAFGDALREVPA